MWTKNRLTTYFRRGKQSLFFNDNKTKTRPAPLNLGCHNRTPDHQKQEMSKQKYQQWQNAAPIQWFQFTQGTRQSQG